MKIKDTEFNDYKRKFITIEVEPNEVCKTEMLEGFNSFFPIDPDGTTHHIEIRKRHFSTGLTGQTIGYGKTFAFGCGSGAAMGWTLGVSLKTAINACKAFCAVIESNTLVARVYFGNVDSDMEAYAKDKPIKK